MEEQLSVMVSKLGTDHERVKAMDQYLKYWNEDIKAGYYTYYVPVITSGQKPSAAGS